MSYISIPSALVRVLKDSNVILEALTDVNGVAEFYLPEGGYTVCASKEGYGDRCQTLYINSDTDLLLLLRTVVRMVVQDTAELEASATMTDKGSILCLATLRDPGDPKIFPYNGYSELYTWCSQDEFDNNWSIVDTQYATAEVHDNALRPKATASEITFYVTVQRILPKLVDGVYYAIMFNKYIKETVDLIEYMHESAEYPNVIIRLHNLASGNKVKITFIKNQSSSFSTYCHTTITMCSTWDGSLAIKHYPDYKELHIYDSCGYHYPVYYGDCFDHDLPIRVHVKLQCNSRSSVTTPGLYYTPFLDWIGFRYI